MKSQILDMNIILSKLNFKNDLFFIIVLEFIIIKCIGRYLI